MTDGPTPRSLPLILARELAANLATPMFLIDAGGVLVFYNEAAELMLGKTFAEMGEVTANEFGGMLELADVDGTPLRRRDTPAGVAFYQRAPAHRTLYATTLDGTRRKVEVTAYPLFGRAEDMHGVLSVFWGVARVRITVWGCRGSLAAPGADTIRYGGNTSCVEVRGSNGEAVVLDAGTGMRPLGVAMAKEGVRQVHVFLSHLHLDHLQGLGFFRPLFDPAVDVHIWGPASPVQPLAERIATYLSPPLFPVRLADIPSTITFHDAPEEAVTIGGLRVRASLVTHQGPTVGYRVEEDGRSVAYLPDHEPGLGLDLADQPPDWISGHDIAHGVDVLLHDAQYGDEEYPHHVGWGHSAIAHVVAFARKAEVDRLVLFHHDPYHTDVELEALVDEARLLWGDDGHRVCSAWEGMAVGLDAGGVTMPVIST